MSPSGPATKRKAPVPRAAPASPTRIAIVVEEAKWRLVASNLRPRLRRAARLALARAHDHEAGSLTILLADDAALQRLNKTFRGKNKPTNVLSFPAPANPEHYLGDIAIAHGVTAREAEEAGKSFVDHATHLAVHGVLHLLGYDHETLAEAKVMEPLEVEILKTLGIADPYSAAAAQV